MRNAKYLLCVLYCNASLLFGENTPLYTGTLTASQPEILKQGDVQVNPIGSELVDDDSISEKRSLKQKLDEVNKFMQWYLKYFPFPYASYSDETNLLVGISKYNAFTLRKHGIRDSTTQPSSASLFGYFTLNRQYKSVLETNFMFDKNKAQWKTSLIYSDYPLEFFGIGNHTKLGDQRTLLSSDMQITTYYLFRMIKKWYVGPSVDYSYYYRVKLEDPDEVADLPGYQITFDHDLGVQSGAGLKVLMEGRNNRLNASRGFFVDVSYLFYRKQFGGNFHYDAFLADLRYYTPVRKKVVLATQLHSESRTGDVPVQSLSMLGGDYLMRGTYRGRYRDKVSVDTQAELRFPIYWIIGGVLFNGLGQVAGSYDQLKVNGFRYSYGAGLRLQMDPVHNINVRFDYGRCGQESVFIINVAEAF